MPNEKPKLDLECLRRADVREGCVGVYYSLALGLTDKVGEQDKLET